MNRELILIGGGEHARSVVDAISTHGTWQLVGYVDLSPSPQMEELGVRRLGDDGDALGKLDSSWFVSGVGELPSEKTKTRGQVLLRYASAGAKFATVVHGRAIVSEHAVLKPGVVILAGAIVNTGAVIEEHAIINTGAIVEHDVVIGPFSCVAPGAIIGGGVHVGRGAYLGLGCRIRDHVTIGAGAVIGMGAVVVGNIADGVTVVGTPARAYP